MRVITFPQCFLSVHSDLLLASALCKSLLMSWAGSSPVSRAALLSDLLFHLWQPLPGFQPCGTLFSTLSLTELRFSDYPRFGFSGGAS